MAKDSATGGKGFLANVPGNQKRFIYIGLVAAGFLGLLWLFAGESEVKTRDNEIKNILTDKSTDELGIESLLAEIKLANDNVRRLENKIDGVTSEQNLARAEYRKNVTALQKVGTIERNMMQNAKQTQEQIQALSNKLTDLAQNNSKLEETLKEQLEVDVSEPKEEEKKEEADKDKQAKEVSKPLDLVTQKTQSQPLNLKSESKTLMQRKLEEKKRREDELANDINRLYAEAPIPQGNEALDENGISVPQPITTSIISEKLPPKKKNANKKKKLPPVYIPSGSMLKGVMLAGIDAPTGNNARKDPFPVQVRIQKDAILPNGYKADLKECFLLMSGYGDMSSERALLRGEQLSCITDNGEIIQANLPSYAAGEDGKAGLRGRLVSKTGSILAKTLLAGFASGASEAFDVSVTPTLSTTSTGKVEYMDAMSSEAFQGAGVKGVSNALERLSDYYMNLAEEMFPIIEIDGGREITVVVTQGTELKPMEREEDKDDETVTQDDVIGENTNNTVVE